MAPQKAKPPVVLTDTKNGYAPAGAMVPPTMFGRDVEASSDDSFFFELALARLVRLAATLTSLPFLVCCFLTADEDAALWSVPPRGAAEAPAMPSPTRLKQSIAISRWRARGESALALASPWFSTNDQACGVSLRFGRPAEDPPLKLWGA